MTMERLPNVRPSIRGTDRPIDASAPDPNDGRDAPETTTGCTCVRVDGPFGFEPPMAATTVMITMVATPTTPSTIHHTVRGERCRTVSSTLPSMPRRIGQTAVMPRMQPDDLDVFLDQPHVGVLATLRRSGLPYTVPVWFDWDGEAAWITGTYERVWCKQLRADRRASLCVEAMTPMAGHVGLDGTVTIHELPEFDIWPISSRLVDKYVRRPMGNAAADAFLDNMRTEHRLLFRLVPEVTRAIDMRVYRGKRADRDYQERHRPAAG